MTKRTKNALFIIVLSAMAALLFLIFTDRDNVQTKAFKVEDGWGYSISVDGKVVINQPMIPGVEGNRPFETKRDALKVGRIVKKKILNDVEPSVTIEELHKAGISTT